MNAKDLEEALEMGVDWSMREGYAWAEDKEHCEEFGRMLSADPSKVSTKAKKRGLPQLGTLGAGNHYAEIQVVDEIFDAHSAGMCLPAGNSTKVLPSVSLFLTLSLSFSINSRTKRFFLFCWKLQAKWASKVQARCA